MKDDNSQCKLHIYYNNKVGVGYIGFTLSIYPLIWIPQILFCEVSKFITLTQTCVHVLWILNFILDLCFYYSHFISGMMLPLDKFLTFAIIVKFYFSLICEIMNLGFELVVCLPIHSINSFDIHVMLTSWNENVSDMTFVYYVPKFEFWQFFQIGNLTYNNSLVSSEYIVIRLFKLFSAFTVFFMIIHFAHSFYCTHSFWFNLYLHT